MMVVSDVVVLLTSVGVNYLIDNYFIMHESKAQRKGSVTVKNEEHVDN